MRSRAGWGWLGLLATLGVLVPVGSVGARPAGAEPAAHHTSGRLGEAAASPTAARLVATASAVRLEVAFSGERLPLYDLEYDPRSMRALLQIRNVDAQLLRLPGAQSDPLVSSVGLRRLGPLRAEYTMQLAYPVPASSLRVREQAGAISLEVDRDFDERTSLPLTHNVTWQRREVREHGAYFLLNELEVDLGAKGVTVDLVHGHDSLEATEAPSAMAERTQALALINGGFFSFGGGGAGLVVEGGRIRKPPVTHRPPRTALGLTRDGRPRMDRVAVKAGALAPLSGADWSEVVTALGGGPRLVTDGRVNVTADDEGLGRSGNNITHACGRTAVAILRNRHLLFVTLSGFSDNHAEGWKLDALARWLVARGAVDAMGYDGGGSTAMVLDTLLVSRGWGNQKPERPVANAWVVRDSTPRLAPSRVEVKLAPPRLVDGQPGTLRVEVTVTDRDGQPVADGTPVHFFTATGRIAARAVTTGGRATALWTCLVRPGRLSVMCYSGLAWGEAGVQLEAGPPAVLRAWRRAAAGAPAAVVSGLAPLPRPTPQEGEALSPLSVQPGSEEGKVEAVVTDAWFNPLSRREVALVDGTSGRVLSTGRTDDEGRVELSCPLPAHLLVHCEGLSAEPAPP